MSQALVAPFYNPSSSGGRDQEYHGSKPAQASSSWDPISKNPFTKKGLWSGLSCRPSVQAPVLQKKVTIIVTHFVGKDGFILSKAIFNSL
jgi:hypothetical protein